MVFPPPLTGHAQLPVTRGAGPVPVPPPPACLGAGAGVAVGIGSPFAPGSTSTWPTIRLVSVSSLVATMSSIEILFAAASDSSVSPALTVTTGPATAGERAADSGGCPGLHAADGRCRGSEADNGCNQHDQGNGERDRPIRGQTDEHVPSMQSPSGRGPGQRQGGSLAPADHGDR